tara:strand:+ start:870 stop:1049 length:180 start_codon:yes stop_codon:yes gene_type:complete
MRFRNREDVRKKDTHVKSKGRWPCEAVGPPLIFVIELRGSRGRERMLHSDTYFLSFQEL